MPIDKYIQPKLFFLSSLWGREELKPLSVSSFLPVPRFTLTSCPGDAAGVEGNFSLRRLLLEHVGFPITFFLWDNGQQDKIERVNLPNGDPDSNKTIVRVQFLPTLL